MTRNIDHLIVHSSATEHGEDFSAADIDKWHRAKGWLGNGYHFVIRLDGTIESHAKGDRTRPIDKPGAHVGGCGKGWNRRSVGICLIGGLTNGEPTGDYAQAQFDSLYWLINDLDEEFHIPGGQIMGHRDLIEVTDSSPKACPCFDVKPWLVARYKAEAEFEGIAPFNENFD